MTRSARIADGEPVLIERIVSRDRVVVAVCLVFGGTLAWWWLLSTGRAMPAKGASIWSPAYLTATFSMWALMMVAMMLPSAAPMILLHARFARRAAGNALGASVAFVFAYLAVWTLFSAAATLAQALLIATGLVAEMRLAIGDRRIAGAVLILAGLYQLSPLKRACLAECRSPLSFVMRLWRPGIAGALRLGLAHGAYCLGCCWALMLLLFVGGVMSIAWIAGLAIIVFVEKLAPPQLPAGKVFTAALLIGGSLMALDLLSLG